MLNPKVLLNVITRLPLTSAIDVIASVSTIIPLINTWKFALSGAGKPAGAGANVLPVQVNVLAAVLTAVLVVLLLNIRCNATYVF